MRNNFVVLKFQAKMCMRNVLEIYSANGIYNFQGFPHCHQWPSKASEMYLVLQAVAPRLLQSQRSLHLSLAAWNGSKEKREHLFAKFSAVILL